MDWRAFRASLILKEAERDQRLQHLPGLYPEPEQMQQAPQRLQQSAHWAHEISAVEVGSALP